MPSRIGCIYIAAHHHDRQDSIHCHLSIFIEHNRSLQHSKYALPTQCPSVIIDVKVRAIITCGVLASPNGVLSSINESSRYAIRSAL